MIARVSPHRSGHASRALTPRLSSNKPRPLATRSSVSKPSLACTMATTNPQPTTQASGPGAATSTPSFSSLGIRNSTVNEADGVRLNDHQRVVVGSVLDLFEGNPTLKHFSLWSPTATFEDPITKAQGEARYKAQWYGLVSLFHPIRLRSHRVVDAGNPVVVELSNRYTVRGIGKEQTVDSIVSIRLGADGRVEHVADRWNGKLHEGVVIDTLRKLNAVTVPVFVTVPKTEEEDMKMKAARDAENSKA